MSATIKPFTDEFEEYGRDESRASGEASSISFPTTEDEVRAILEKLHAERVPVTVQGARTGLAAGAVPHGGHILNTSRMNRYLGLRRDEQGQFLLRVEPGVVLSELRKQLSKKVLPTAGWDQASLKAYDEFQEAPEQFFPTDPTEASACLGHGGMQRLRRPQLRLRPHAPISRTPRRAGYGDLLELQRGRLLPRAATCRS
ncbi:MAG: FAD-binding oxidoreductase [Collinsella aerofaciens]